MPQLLQSVKWGNKSTWKPLIHVGPYYVSFSWFMRRLVIWTWLTLPASSPTLTGWSRTKLCIIPPKHQNVSYLCLCSRCPLPGRSPPPSSVIHLHPQHPAWGHAQGSCLVNVCGTVSSTGNPGFCWWGGGGLGQGLTHLSGALGETPLDPNTEFIKRWSE